ncbi:MAG: hypothetical protein WA006_09735 [Rhodoglobus sp.]
MSDDTPTAKFDSTGGAPTEALGTSAAEVPQEVAEERKSRRLILILGIIGGALLLGVIILLVLLLTRGAGNPGGDGTATPTPSATATATPTPTPSVTPTPTPTPTATAAPPPPPDTSTKVDAFSGTNQIFCNTQAPNPPSYVLSFSWQTSNADQIYFGVATNDAQAGALFDNLPPSGNSQDDFPYAVEFPCPSQSQIYTLTAVGDSGKVSKTITVTNTGDTQ